MNGASAPFSTNPPASAGFSMSDRELIKPVAGGFSYLHREDGQTRVGTLVDCSATIEAVKQRRAAGATEGPFGHHKASIDIEKLDEWAKKISAGALNAFDVANDDALLDRFLVEHPAYVVRGGWQ